jgi:hypothetical protein
VREEAEKELVRLRHGVAALAKGNKDLADCVARQSAERDLASAAARQWSDRLRMGAARFEAQRKAVDAAQAALTDALERQRALVTVRKRTAGAQAECERVAKMVLRAEAEAAALSCEAEGRINVHRWTLAEWTDPAVGALLRMRAALHDALCTRTAEMDRMEAERRRIADALQSVRLPRAQQRADEEGVEKVLWMRTRELERLEEKVGDGAELRAKKKMVDELRELICRKREEVGGEQQKIREAKGCLSGQTEGNPRRKGGRIGGGFPAEGSWEVPGVDLRKTGGKKQARAVVIRIPKSGRQNRAKTLVVGDRNRMRATLSARLPDEDL